METCILKGKLSGRRGRLDHALQTEQRGLVAQSAAIAGEAAVRAHHTVAGHNQADGVPAHSAAHGPRRTDSQMSGDFPVGHDAPPRDGADHLQHLFSERGQVVHLKDWGETGLTA